MLHAVSYILGFHVAPQQGKCLVDRWQYPYGKPTHLILPLWWSKSTIQPGKMSHLDFQGLFWDRNMLHCEMRFLRILESLHSPERAGQACVTSWKLYDSLWKSKMKFLFSPSSCSSRSRIFMYCRYQSPDFQGLETVSWHLSITCRWHHSQRKEVWKFGLVATARPWTVAGSEQSNVVIRRKIHPQNHHNLKWVD